MFLRSATSSFDNIFNLSIFYLSIFNLFSICAYLALRYAKFSTNSSLAFYVVGAKIQFYACHTVIFGIFSNFFLDSAKEMGTSYMFLQQTASYIVIE